MLPGIKDGTCFLGERVSDSVAMKKVYQRLSCLWIRSAFPLHPTLLSPKESAAIIITQWGHLDSSYVNLRPSQ